MLLGDVVRSSLVPIVVARICWWTQQKLVKEAIQLDKEAFGAWLGQGGKNSGVGGVQEGHGEALLVFLKEDLENH